jgi:thiamine-phosphate pyrophosphorylase
MINTVGVENSEVFIARMRRFVDEVSVYPVTCEKLSAGRSDQQWLDGVLAGGARIVQLRDKESKDNVLLEKARYFRYKTREAGALFIINDRLDIALLSDADGMHVGQGDLPPEEIRKLAPDIIIGLSCNTVDHVHELNLNIKNKISPVSYYNVGPIYRTGTKKGLQSFLGADVISTYTGQCGLPFTVMGGIKLSHVDELIAAGATRIAVVTAISQAENIAEETALWDKRIITSRKKLQELVHNVA